MIDNWLHNGVVCQKNLMHQPLVQPIVILQYCRSAVFVAINTRDPLPCSTDPSVRLERNLSRLLARDSTFLSDVTDEEMMCAKDAGSNNRVWSCRQTQTFTGHRVVGLQSAPQLSARSNSRNLPSRGLGPHVNANDRALSKSGTQAQMLGTPEVFHARSSVCGLHLHHPTPGATSMMWRSVRTICLWLSQQGLELSVLAWESSRAVCRSRHMK